VTEQSTKDDDQASASTKAGSEAADSGKRERVATLALLALAAVAAGAVVWGTRGAPPATEQATPSVSVARSSPPEATRPALVVPRRKEAQDVLDATCAGVASPDCACRLKALERSFSLADSKLNAALLLKAETEETCTKSPAFAGLKAEALARTSSPSATEFIAATLAHAPTDAHALFADAYQHLLSGNRDKIEALLGKAEQAGRGAAVHTLRGVWQIQQRQREAAKASFAQAIALDSDDVDAMYNLAVLEAEGGGYNKPRSLFLKVLKLRPDHLDARFALASLTHKAGATPEAKRQQALLEALAPTGDARVIQLRALMTSASDAPSASPFPGAPPEFHVRKKSGTP